MSFAIIRLFLGGALKGVIAWLSRRTFWQLVCMGLTALFMVQHFQLVGARHSAAKWQQQYTRLHTQFGELERQSKIQQDQVAKTVDHYITVERPVIRNQVERIESAPLPGGCRTPSEVRDADV